MAEGNAGKVVKVEVVVEQPRTLGGIIADGVHAKGKEYDVNKAAEKQRLQERLALIEAQEKKQGK
jgi:hypothetical protein